MANNNEPTGPAIAPTLVIVTCISSAVVLVIIVAALYRLCRRARAEPDEDVENKTWNPNKRNKDQDKYMEEVRWRNNANVWKTANQRSEEYRPGWFRAHIEEQRGRGQAQKFERMQVSSSEEETDASG